MRIKELLNSKSIRIAAVGSVGIKFGSSFFAFLNGVLLARFLSLEGMGQYVLVFSAVSILLIPTTLGLPIMLTRFVSKYIVRDRYDYIKGLLSSANRFVLIATLSVYFICLILYFLWWKNYNSAIVQTIIYGLLLLPVLGFGGLRSGVLRGMKHVILAEMPDTLLRNLFFTILLGIFHFFGDQLTPDYAMLLHLIAAGIAFVLGYIFLRRNLLFQLEGVKPKYNQKEWIRQTLPFSIIGGVQVVRAKSFSVILAIFSSVEAVAIFDIAFRGAALVSFTLNALNSAVSPFVSSLYEQGNMKSLQRVLTKTSRIIFILSVPVAMIFLIGGRPFLTFLFGQGYAASYVPLLILCTGQLVNAGVGSVGMVLNMTGHQKVYSNNNLWMLLFSVLLCVPLVIYYNAIGAAIVFCFIMIIQNLILFYYVRKNMNFKTSIF